jgi:hypothetical protein
VNSIAASVRDSIILVAWNSHLDRNGIGRETLENEIRSSFLKVKFDRHCCPLHPFVNFTYPIDVFLDKSNMKVGWIDRSRGVTQITEAELEPAIVYVVVVSLFGISTPTAISQTNPPNRVSGSANAMG